MLYFSKTDDDYRSIYICIIVYELLSKIYNDKNAVLNTYIRLFEAVDFNNPQRLIMDLLRNARRSTSTLDLADFIEDNLAAKVDEFELNCFFLVNKEHCLIGTNILKDALRAYAKSKKLFGQVVNNVVEYGQQILLSNFKFENIISAEWFIEHTSESKKKYTFYGHIYQCLEDWNISKTIIDTYGKAAYSTGIKSGEDGKFSIFTEDTTVDNKKETEDFTNQEIYKNLMSDIVRGSKVLFSATRSGTFEVDGRSQAICRNILTYYAEVEAQKLDTLLNPKGNSDGSKINYEFYSIFRNTKTSNSTSTTESDIVSEAYGIIKRIDNIIESLEEKIDKSEHLMLFQNKVYEEFKNSTEDILERSIEKSTLKVISNDSLKFSEVFSGVLSAKFLISILKYNGYSILCFPNCIITQESVQKPEMDWTKKSSIKELVEFRNMYEDVLGDEYAGQPTDKIYNITIVNILQKEDTAQVSPEVLKLYEEFSSKSTSKSAGTSPLFKNLKAKNGQKRETSYSNIFSTIIANTLNKLGIPDESEASLGSNLAETTSFFKDIDSGVDYDDSADLFKCYYAFRELYNDPDISKTLLCVIKYVLVLLSWFCDAFKDSVPYNKEPDIPYLLYRYNSDIFKKLQKTINSAEDQIQKIDGSERVFSIPRYITDTNTRSLYNIFDEVKGLCRETNMQNDDAVRDFIPKFNAICEELICIILAWQDGREDEKIFLGEVCNNSSEKSSIENLFNLINNIRFLRVVMKYEADAIKWLQMLKANLTANNVDISELFITETSIQGKKHFLFSNKLICKTLLNDLQEIYTNHNGVNSCILKSLVAGAYRDVWGFTQEMYERLQQYISKIENAAASFCFKSIKDTLNLVDTRKLDSEVATANQKFSSWVIQNKQRQFNDNPSSNISSLLQINVSEAGDYLLRYEDGTPVVVNVFNSTESLTRGKYYFSTSYGLTYNVLTEKVEDYNSELSEILRTTMRNHGDSRYEYIQSNKEKILIDE